MRRPHDRERSTLIKSGSVFIYEESASGIKRWTDGVPWSPSRILNNFLIYRELEKPFPPGEKKRATKKLKRDPRPGEPYARPMSNEDRVSPSPPTPHPPAASPLPTASTLQTDPSVEKESERQLVGSLTDSYQFKPGGLVKKTMSVKVDEVSYHLVSYYTPEDVKAGLLDRPLEVANLRDIDIRPELLHRQNFRAPLDDQLPAPEESPQASYRVQPQNSNSYSAPMSYVPGHSYLPQPQINSNQAYYGGQMPPSYHHMAPPPIQQHTYMQQSRVLPGPAVTAADSYYHNIPAPSPDHYSSYSDQRQQQYPRTFYGHQQQQLPPTWEGAQKWENPQS